MTTSAPISVDGTEFLLKTVICIYTVFQLGMALVSTWIFCTSGILDFLVSAEQVAKRGSEDHDDTLLTVSFITVLWYFIGCYWSILMLRRQAVPREMRLSNFLISQVYSDLGSALCQPDPVGMTGLLQGRIVAVSLTLLALPLLFFMDNELLMVPCIMVVVPALMMDLPAVLIMNAMTSRLALKAMTKSSGYNNNKETPPLKYKYPPCPIHRRTHRCLM